MLFFYKNGNFDTAWKALFKLCWPGLAIRVQPVDWHQIYWETHVQKYVDSIMQDNYLLVIGLFMISNHDLSIFLLFY